MLLFLFVSEELQDLKIDLNDVKNCIENSKKILSLPMFPELEMHEMEYICLMIRVTLKNSTSDKICITFKFHEFF